LSKKVVFTGSAVAIITPMKEDRSINYDKLAELIEFQIAGGTDSILICGTTGEPSTMTDEEHSQTIAFTVKQVAGRVPVIAGAGSNDTAYAVWLSKEAEAAGADALLHVTPYYNKCTQKGLVAHFTTIADNTNLPIILYNVPSRTGVDILPQTYAELAKHPNIVGTKEANGNITAAARTRALCGDDLTLYTGNDDQAVATLSLGGKGVISVLANFAPKFTHDMVMAYLSGDAEKAGRMQVDYIGLIDALFCETNPIPVKEAMNMIGMNVGPCRLPLTEMEPANKQRLYNELAKRGFSPKAL